MNPEWWRITFREFHDVPRAVIVWAPSRVLFLDCPWDDALDDYRPTYDVYALPAEVAAALPHDWTDLGLLGDFLGSVEVDAVRFDSTRRQAVDSAILAPLLRTP